MRKPFSFQAVFLLYRIQPHNYAKESFQVGSLRSIKCNVFDLRCEGSQKALPTFDRAPARSDTTDVSTAEFATLYRQSRLCSFAVWDTNMSVAVALCTLS